MIWMESSILFLCKIDQAQFLPFTDGGFTPLMEVSPQFQVCTPVAASLVTCAIHFERMDSCTACEWS